MLRYPDPDPSQLPLLDPTQQRYELIRPLLLCPERTATQRAQETGTHPETVRRLKHRLAQQGMLGLVPDTLEVFPARRQLRVPDTVVYELQRLKGLYQTMAEDHARKSVGECHPYREFEGMQSSI